MVPGALTAYSVVGEREQSTLAAVLTTPIRREEFLIGKAFAAFVRTLLIAYVFFGVFLGAADLFAHPAVVSTIFERSHVLVQLLFTPLLAGWSIWMGIAIAARSTDVRSAQQLTVFASLPPLGVVALLSFNVIPASVLALASRQDCSYSTDSDGASSPPSSTANASLPADTTEARRERTCRQRSSCHGRASASSYVVAPSMSRSTVCESDRSNGMKRRSSPSTPVTIPCNSERVGIRAGRKPSTHATSCLVSLPRCNGVAALARFRAET